MQIIPLQPTASQTVTVTLNTQPCTINVYQLSTGLYIDLYVNNSLIVGGVICENLNVIVRSAYLGFVGDLAFFDTAGSDDPNYSLLGSRFCLGYYSPSDLLPYNLS